MNSIKEETLKMKKRRDDYEKTCLSRQKEKGFNAQKELELGSCKDTSAIIRWKEEYMSKDGDQILI